MNIVTLLAICVGILVVGSIAAWLINKFFEPPIRMPLMAVMGVLLLIVLIALFFPGVSGIKVW